MNPSLFWPLPGKLRSSCVTLPSALEVEVQLLNGHLIYGLLATSEKLSELVQLKLAVHGQQVTIPVSTVRSVARFELFASHADVADARINESGPVHEEVLNFHLVFVDGQTLDGQTLGYVNKKVGGVFLYVRQPDARFKALWMPRPSLKNVRIELLVPAILPTPPANPMMPVKVAVAVPKDESMLALASSMDELANMLEDARAKPMISMAQALFELKLMTAETLHELQAGTPAQLRAYIDTRLAKLELSELQLEWARAVTVNTPMVNAEAFKVEPHALTKIDWPVAERNLVVPLGMISGSLYVASATPMSRELQDRLSVIAGCNVELVWSSKTHIDNRIAREKLLGVSPETNPEQAPSLPDGRPEAFVQDLQFLLESAQNEIKVHGVQIHSYAVDERSSIVKLVKRIIMDAYQQKASDIHIETNPGDELSRVRFRIDGDLEEYLKLPADLRAALVSRIKVMSKLDISERRRPQDGKINFADFSDIKLELRVAILPTHDNLEDVVLRLLASSKPIALAKLGFSERDEKIVKRLAQRPYGLILACGPTGSGKTTTLHSLLSEINTENRKIWTAEDPIEITQPGLRQLQVNPKIGVTFASAMRAFLRADPDVIMIGEIRDEETARIAIEASLTGHLVLSTLHTNNAAESVVRLLDLGMDPMNFADSLIGIVAQRLVRALCKNCKVRESLSNQAFEQLAQEYMAGTNLDLEQARTRLLQAAQVAPGVEISLYRAFGCDSCGGKGYKGRMGIYETLENSPELKHLIQTRAVTSRIFEQAIASGTRSLRQDALEKVFAGAIDHKQAMTVYS